MLVFPVVDLFHSPSKEVGEWRIERHLVLGGKSLEPSSLQYK